jgi:hypothetical protein
MLHASRASSASSAVQIQISEYKERFSPLQFSLAMVHL